MSLAEEPEEETVTGEYSAPEEQEETFVISVDDGESDEDFLSLDDETSEEKEDDGLLGGIAGGKQDVATEVLLEGIEMDVEEQIAAVTRAELLLASGKQKEASEILSDVSNKKGVTPWVTKLLEQIKSS